MDNHLFSLWWLYVQYIRSWYDAGSGGGLSSLNVYIVFLALSSCCGGVGRDVDQHCRCPRRAVTVLRDDAPVNGVRVAGIL